MSRPGRQPAGSFTHSGAKFTIQLAPGAIRFTMTRDGLSATYNAEYVIGSGAHAYGFLVRAGNYLFQAPVSYYSNRRLWDVAPGYEDDPQPDFSRPVSAECLQCHAGHPKAVPATLNRYDPLPSADDAISCDRCHGDAGAHARNPSRNNIINPRRLPPRARDSVCEQCHLSGEVRVPNPGRQFSDFHPGKDLEEVFTVYVRDRSAFSPASPIKVVSHAEQLAWSTCARKSGGKLWCGTCHNPHEATQNRLQRYRTRCLGCHGESVMRTHSKPADDCVSCHMPKRKAKDGAHTVFTDHRISRTARAAQESPAREPVRKLVAWREPADLLKERNLGLASVEVGERDRSPELLDEGARLLIAAMKVTPPDPVVLTKLGLVLLRKQMAGDAVEVLEYVLKLEPDRGGSHANLGLAYKEAGMTAKAVAEFERAIQLDPSLETAYRALGEIYMAENDLERVRGIFQRYLAFMPTNLSARKTLAELPAR